MTTPDPAAFATVDLNTKKESACSPKMDPAFRGIAIAAPDAADLDGPRQDAVGVNRPLPILPVCGTARYTAATDARFRSLNNQMLLVAVDARTHVPYAGNLVKKGFEPAIVKPPTPAELEARKDHVYTSFFNANAFYYLDLPERPATYHVFATIGDLVSNVRTVMVKGRGDQPAMRALVPGEALFGQAAKSPTVPPDFRGIRIQPRVQRWPIDGGPVWLDGIIQLDAAAAAGLGATPIQKALVVTASSDFLFRAWTAAGERALFVDDQQSTGDVVRGTFSLELSKAFAPSPYDGVYLLVSAGATTSNVVFIPNK